MKRLFLTMLLLSLIAPFTVQSQDNKAVQEVYAKAKNDAVDLVWSFNDIVPESMVVDFETGDFSQADFFVDPTNPWVITESAFEGKYAIKSTCEGVSNGVSAIEVTVDVPFDATMSFYHKVDCEYYFDNARFFIDGVERDLITGKKDWAYREYKVSKGTHTYRWTFRKDSEDFEVTADAYFVDNIVLYKKIEPFAGGWIHYDDGHFVQDVGSQSYNVDWAICYPNTEEYAGYNLTKVALYNNDLPATVKANIYFGGVDAPGELVHSQEFKLKGTSSIVELELSAPLPIDGTEPLWISFHNECSANAYVYPATGCNPTDTENSDWVSWDKGETWEHLAKSNVYLTWMIRGYLENSNGEKAVLAKERNIQEYKVYRKNNFTDKTELIAEKITDTVYKDNSFATAGFGLYSWGVAATYDNGDAETTWSNVISKDMYTTLNLNVTANSSDVVEGAKVKFVNLTEPEQGFDYKVTLDATGIHAFDRFRKGNYKLTVSLSGYEKYEQEIEIIEAKDVNVVLEEITANVANLNVSPTGWATWENVGETDNVGSFYFDFEKGTLDGWTTVDADGDGLNWRVTTDILGPGNGYQGSKYCVISQSWCTDSVAEAAALKPDNYLITTDKYLITEDSELSYYVCAQDETSPMDHYAVMVSTSTELDSFVTLFEETLNRGTSATRNGRAQGAWYKRVIDLKTFAGQEVYVAFRHFNTIGQFYVDVDNIALVNNAKSSSKSRSLNGYTVKLNDEVVANNVETNYYQFEGLTDGETYKATVIANYTTGASEAVDYTWTYVSPAKYAGVKTIEGRAVAGKAFLEWTLEGDDEAEEAESSFSFNFSDGTLNGWRSLDADNDGYGWYNSAEKIGPGYGYKDDYCAMSHSFYSYVTENGNQYNMSLTPDNYLITEKKYAITNGSQLSFLVSALDPEFHAEHYGVAITMQDNATAEDFVMVFEETIVNDKLDEWDGQTAQTEWVLRTIDLSKYAGEEVYIAIRHFNCTDQYIINIDDVALTTAEKSTRDEKEILGVMVFCEDELLTPEPVSERNLYTDFPGYDEYTYCVRVVYSDYGMSEEQCVLVDAPMQCVAPRNLYGEMTVNSDGEYGVSLVWPFEHSEWLYYDNDIAKQGFHNNGNLFYWGIMLPKDILADYVGTAITKVKLFDVEAANTTVLVYYGTKTSPTLLQHSQSVSLKGTKQWVEIALDKAVPVTGEHHVWVVCCQTGTAVLCEDTGDKVNGRWVSLDGSTWIGVDAYVKGHVWALKAFVTSNYETERGIETKELELPINENVNDEVSVTPLDEVVTATETREPTFQHYNLYRGTDLNEMTLLAETKEGKYFDVISQGVYYYQVRSVYKDGEEVCESEPANSFQNHNQYYVKIDMLSIGETNVNGMMVYPNPAKENLTIKAEGMTRITITNTLGQVVYDNDVNTDKEVINMSQYDAGIYMVRVTTENGTVVRKVSKL